MALVRREDCVRSCPSRSFRFQGGTANPGTGLENIGVREYDPATAAFTSPDPLLSPTDPQDLNPYAYVKDGPPSEEDPTGQMACAGPGSTDCWVQGNPPPSNGNSGGGSHGSGKSPSGNSGSGGYDVPQPCNLLGELCNPAIYGGHYGTGLPPTVRMIMRKILAQTAVKISNFENLERAIQKCGHWFELVCLISAGAVSIHRGMVYASGDVPQGPDLRDIEYNTISW